MSFRNHPDDEYEAMMRGVLTFMIMAFIVACLGVFFSGCVNAPVAPNLKLPEGKECPKIPLEPVPENVALQIHGDKVDADAGGELLLRSYVACRAALK